MPTVTPTVYKPQPADQVADRIYRTGIDGLLYLEHNIHPDDRGFFAELNLIPDLNELLSEPFSIQQINLAHSNQNVIRGIHAEGWNKLITLVRGTAFSALVDVRPDSQTFAHTVTFLLGTAPEALKGSLYIPQGIGNSVCVTEGPVDYLYCVDRLYRNRDKAGDAAITLFDPDLNIPWPIPRESMILSNRDKEALTLHQKFPAKF